MTGKKETPKALSKTAVRRAKRGMRKIEREMELRVCFGTLFESLAAASHVTSLMTQTRDSDNLRSYEHLLQKAKEEFVLGGERLFALFGEMIEHGREEV